MSIPFHSLHLNSQTREWSFHSLLFKLPNRGKKRIILKYFFFFFFPFHSFPSSQMECYSSWMVIGISNCWFNQDKQNPYKPTFPALSSCPNSNAWMSSQLTQSTDQDQESGGCGNRRTSLRIWKLGWYVISIKVQDRIFFFF